MAFDVMAFTQRLIRCESVTPFQAGSLDLIEEYLNKHGFRCHRLVFGEGVDNLYARRGLSSPHLCFAGHVDVVPAGKREAWKVPPFEGTRVGDQIYGRGAVDMKGAIAAFLGALDDLVPLLSPTSGSLSLLITADEEGIARDGTQKVLEWMREKKETIDHCLVGEPSSEHHVGDTLKVGRLGSLNTHLTCYGKQGHVAYPLLADNPLPRLIKTLSLLNEGPLEAPSAYFPRTNLEITTIDVGNPTVNVIPLQARASFNIRFNDQQTSACLKKWITQICDTYAHPYELSFQVSGEADRCEDTWFINLVKESIFAASGREPACSTGGGTSDARFIRHMCPVLELGLLAQTMHQIDEHVSISDLETLKKIYFCLLQRYFHV